MTQIKVKDEFIDLSCELGDGLTAEEELSAFVRLMFGQSFGLSSIRGALLDVAENLNEQVKIYNEYRDLRETN